MSSRVSLFASSVNLRPDLASRQLRVRNPWPCQPQAIRDLKPMGKSGSRTQQRNAEHERNRRRARVPLCLPLLAGFQKGLWLLPGGLACAEAREDRQCRMRAINQLGAKVIRTISPAGEPEPAACTVPIPRQQKQHSPPARHPSMMGSNRSPISRLHRNSASR